jgi:hypothetical protein
MSLQWILGACPKDHDSRFTAHLSVTRMPGVRWRQRGSAGVYAQRHRDDTEPAPEELQPHPPSVTQPLAPLDRLSFVRCEHPDEQFSRKGNDMTTKRRRDDASERASEALMDLLRAIAAGDVRGATQRLASEYFLSEIAHYVYAGDTALHIAAAAFNPALVSDLIGRGAALSAKNRRGVFSLRNRTRFERSGRRCRARRPATSATTRWPCHRH